MKRQIIFFSLLIFTNQSFAGDGKPKDKFKLKIDSLNYFFSIYDTLSPFSDRETIFDEIESYQKEIIKRLLDILNDKRIVNYEIEALLKKNIVSISKSDDSKIYFLSIDAKTGGTYRPSINIFHFRLRNGEAKAEILGGYDGMHTDASNSSDYGKIYTIDSLNNTYLAIGGVATCATCVAFFATIIQLDTTSFTRKIVYQYDGRSGLLQFDFDKKVNVFYYDYYAEENDDSIYGGDNPNPTLRHRYKGKYKYIDGEFIEVEKCELWDKNDR